MLNEINHLPDGFLEARAEELFQLLKRPTLIHLDGENPKPLFISTLLHGNETTGLYTLQALLASCTDTPLPRALSIFIGNVEAAASNQRRLPTQQDYNRIWPGTHLDDSIETDTVKTVTHIMRKKKPFASIDIHNNTGKNPHYGCINILNPHGLQLAAMFSDIAVYFTSPKGVQSSAFSDFCPAVVLECGQSGEEDGISHARKYLESVLALDTIPSGQPDNLSIYHTVARVTVPAHVSLGSSTNISQDSHLYLDMTLEAKNFCKLPAKTAFARLPVGNPQPFIVLNESNEDVSEEFFEICDDTVVLKKPVILSMYTTNETAIRQDCLCYLMEQLQIQA